jgi:hypothetical protein
MTSDGGLGNRLKGGLFGGLVGATPLPGQNWAMAKSGAALTGLGMTPHLAQNVAQIGVPLAGIGLLSRQGGGDVTPSVASGAGNVIGGGGGIAAGRLTGSPNINSGDVLGSGNLPPGTTARMIGPQGGVWYQLDPQGLPAGDRLGRQLGAITDANVLNTLGNALYGQTERVAKSELARQAAAEQLKANIDMAKRMSLNSQEAGLRVGMDAGKSMADAMSNRNNFRYL